MSPIQSNKTVNACVLESWCVRQCVHVCVRERGRKRERERGEIKYLKETKMSTTFRLPDFLRNPKKYKIGLHKNVQKLRKTRRKLLRKCVKRFQECTYLNRSLLMQSWPKLVRFPFMIDNFVAQASQVGVQSLTKELIFAWQLNLGCLNYLAFKY